MILRLAENRFQILNARHNADRHFASLLRRVRTRIERRAEALADLTYARFELFALELKKKKLITVSAL